MDSKLTFNGSFFDLIIGSGSLETDQGLYTAVIVSLFSDRQAGDGDLLPDNSEDRRGWWADAFADESGDRIGSRLWLLSRDKQLPETARKVEAYADEALQWLIDDGIAKAVQNTAEWIGRGILALEAVIIRPDGTTLNFRFDNLWEALNAL